MLGLQVSNCFDKNMLAFPSASGADQRNHGLVRIDSVFLPKQIGSVLLAKLINCINVNRPCNGHKIIPRVELGINFSRQVCFESDSIGQSKTSVYHAFWQESGPNKPLQSCALMNIPDHRKVEPLRQEHSPARKQRVADEEVK